MEILKVRDPKAKLHKNPEVPVWYSGLRTWHCHSWGAIHNCGTGLSPGPGSSTCYGHGKKKNLNSKAIHCSCECKFYYKNFGDYIHIHIKYTHTCTHSDMKDTYKNILPLFVSYYIQFLAIYQHMC